LKPRSAFILPPRGSRARLPYLVVPVLAAMAVVQLALPERIALPPGGTVARIAISALPDPPAAVLAPPLLASRDLFAPPAKSDVSDPLDGAVIAGVVQKGRLRLAVVQQASGQVRYIGIGGAIAGWRLAALDQAAARLTHGPGQSMLVTYGLHASLPKNANAPQIRALVSPQTIESGQ
jgi:hypothetical protein